MAEFKRDCVYYEVMRPDQYRAYCNKLSRIIRVRDCVGCGWYCLMIDCSTRYDQVSKDLTKLLDDEKKNV